MNRFWDSVIHPAFRIVRPRVIVEIGIDKGLHTQKILKYCSEAGAVLHAVDPEPQCDIAKLQAAHEGHFVFHRDLSLNALFQIDSYDAVLIDGDHNWYTVYHELLLMEKKSREQGYFPLVFLHDVGWPYGRRDLYYAPERIPAIYRKAYAKGGLFPDQGLPAPGGLNERRDFWHAIEENNFQNGVLTALEDFIAKSGEHFSFLNIPVIDGIGILAPNGMLARFPALARLLTDLTPTSVLSTLLSTIEQERIHHIREEQQLQKMLVEEQEHLQQAKAASAEKDASLKHLKAEAGRLARLLAERQEAITRMLSTRSWRWTASLRHGERLLRDLPYSILRALKTVWSGLGKPCPALARFIRHSILGKIWPAKQEGHCELPASPSSPRVESDLSPAQTRRIAVVIPCHNQGHALPETLESILSQTLKPSEILIVDDESEDETRIVANRYAGRGIEYLRGGWHNRNSACNAGLHCTESPLTVFLTAGQKLERDFLEACTNLLATRPDAAIAYADESPHPFEIDRFYRENTIPHYAMVRREALQKVGGWQEGLRRDSEWITWRRILSSGWTAVKYQITSPPRQSLRDSPRVDATLCISLSGRRWMWPLTADFLQHQTYPHDRTHLVFIDTSQDLAFGDSIQEWLQNCDYGRHTYLPITVGIKGLADLPRRTVKREVASACALIYNSFVPHCKTPWVFFLEDDVIPPLNAYPQLLRHFEEDVASVSALCMQRSSPHPIAWEWDHDGMPTKIPEVQEGVTAVGGNGLCCVVLRGQYVREATFHSGPFDLCHDHNFYRPLVCEQGLRALLDWSCVCRHYVAPEEWRAPPSTATIHPTPALCSTAISTS